MEGKVSFHLSIPKFYPKYHYLFSAFIFFTRIQMMYSTGQPREFLCVILASYICLSLSYAFPYRQQPRQPGSIVGHSTSNTTTTTTSNSSSAEDDLANFGDTIQVLGLVGGLQTSKFISRLIHVLI